MNEWGIFTDMCNLYLADIMIDAGNAACWDREWVSFEESLNDCHLFVDF